MEGRRNYLYEQAKSLQQEHLLGTVSTLKIIGSAILMGTIFIAFSGSVASTYIFISFLSFLLVHFYATRANEQLLKFIKRQKILTCGGFVEEGRVNVPWKTALGITVYDGWLLLLIFFDLAWLSNAYLYPSPKESYNDFLLQLTIGPISGGLFVSFTIALWVTFLYFFFVGLTEHHKADSSRNNYFYGSFLQEHWIQVRTYDANSLFLSCHRMTNQGRQPLILFPGFFQNAFIYDLAPNASLARFLCDAGYDIWLVHPRGTVESEGRKIKSSLDDYACDDIPSIISYVKRQTGQPPIFVGHSQGGITATISLMGATKSPEGLVTLSEEAKTIRERNLKGLVTLGSFLDFTFSGKSTLQDFIREGVKLKIFGIKILSIKTKSILNAISALNFLSLPLSLSFRVLLLRSNYFRLTFFPLTVSLNVSAQLRLWNLLYDIKNVNKMQRKELLYKTIEGTFYGILKQFYFAVKNGSMSSSDGGTNYSQNYHLVSIPISMVAMEHDAFADPKMMREKMFNGCSSIRKNYVEWKSMGHEDHFMVPEYFPLVLNAIRSVDEI